MKNQTIPNKKNFCGGNFQDWLEVMLIEKCNGKCKWCVEKKGYHPEKHLSWESLCFAILETKKKTVILLGGEPTLHSDIKNIINYLHSGGVNVFLTSNGSMLTPAFVNENLKGLTGINISIHDYNLNQNKFITGVTICEENLKHSIETLNKNGVIVRINCNLIKNHVDNKEEINKFINFVKYIGAGSVRFAELKQDEKNFINLHSVFGNKYGINNEPFGLGCNIDAKIKGMPVNFRLMCGLQTGKRKKPEQPKQCQKKVLYYDGEIYDGWQTFYKEEIVTDKQLSKLLQEVADGKITPTEAALKIGKEMGDEKVKKIVRHESSGGCQY